MSSPLLYCRFCAERKRGLLNLRTERKARKIVMRRLHLFSEVLVDFNDESSEAHVCGGCYSMLESCAEWVSRVKRSQQLLGALCDSKSEVTLKVEVKECKGRGEDGGSWAAYSWSCGHCAAALPSMDALREHSKSAHTSCFGFKCADCDARPPPAFSDFVRHVRAHRHRLRNYCPYCDIKMEDDTHMELHLNEDRCDTCGGMGHEIDLQKYQTEDIHAQDDQKPDLVNIFPETLCQPILVDESPQSTIPETDSRTDLINIVPKRTNSHKEGPVPKTIPSWSSYPLSCKFCDQNLKCRGKMFSRSAFVSHCMKEHKTCFGMSCVDCSETQESYLEFIEHVRRHRPELRGLCPYCDCKLDDKDKSHIVQHEKYDHLCVLCGKIYTLKNTLRAHQKDTQSPLITPKRFYSRGGAKDLTCVICAVVFSCTTSLRVHIQTHLAREKNFTCEQCGKAFYTKDTLNQHKRVHDDSAIETCKICNKTVRRHCLKAHVETHSMSSEFQCDYCSRWFRSKTMLRLHLPLHLDVRPFECTYCGKGFREKYVLEVHVRQHTGERPFKCISCDKTFVNWSNCNSHMMRIHRTTMANYKHTSQGKVALNADTMEPVKILQSEEVQKWSQEVLALKRLGKKKNSY